MKFIIKLFPEITIKSQSVRLHFIKILSTNIRKILKQYDKTLAISRHWDHIQVDVKDNKQQQIITDELTRIPGICRILLVEDHTYTNVKHILELTLEAYHDKLIGKTFCVRVKRRGQQDFNSQDLERYVGGWLNQHIKNARVNLTKPQVSVNLEVKEKNKLILVKEIYEGIGGYPIGTQGDVLSLISGGFDSSVASYMLIRRGCRVHFCFFNLGGAAHEMGVKKLAHYLWSRFLSSHKVNFIAIDFLPVFSEILEKINDSHQGVILKRMMVRAASQIAKSYGIKALVTGEALGQVSSQTLANLSMIDQVSDKLVLRPLISYDKENIIKIARHIGTEALSKIMPEYCSIVSKKPTVKAIYANIKKEESYFNFSILDQVICKAKNLDISTVIKQVQDQGFKVTSVRDFAENEIILDIRSNDEQEDEPLNLAHIEVKLLPFYRLSSQFGLLDQSKTYLLYCARGIMSHLQALYLLEKGYVNVKVYRP